MYSSNLVLLVTWTASLQLATLASKILRSPAEQKYVRHCYGGPDVEIVIVLAEGLALLHTCLPRLITVGAHPELQLFSAVL